MSNVAVKIAQYPPMLQQYLDYKSRYSDCFLFFQVGDFYEIFFEDAPLVARALNLTLTSRDKNNPDPIPMCGVPVAVIDTYVERLVEAGHSVAIVSQTQNGVAANRQPVERQLERIITPGVRILGNSQLDRSEHLLTAISVSANDGMAIASGDIQTGKITVRDGLSEQFIVGEILRLNPSEIVLPKSTDHRKFDRRIAWISDLERALPGVSLKFRVAHDSSVERGQRTLSDVKGYSALSTAGKRAARLFADYVDETIVNVALPIREITPFREGECVIIDSAARSNLELLRNLRQGNEEHTLINVLDKTHTPGGARLLRRWLASPLVSVEAINDRLDCVQAFLKESVLRSELTSILKFVGDLERVAARIELKVVSPRELSLLRDALKLIPAFKKILAEKTLINIARLQTLESGLQFPDEISIELSRALLDLPEASLAYGGVIRDGYDEEIDRLRAIKSKGKSWIAELEAQERERTGIGSLKIKYNNVLGYFIEITSANLGKVPKEYVRRQSTANTERYTTELLKEREEEVLGAEDKEIKRERELFETLRLKLLPHINEIRELSYVFSELDCYQSLAEVSEREDYKRPQVDNSLELSILDGRHPVLSQLLQNKYVPTSLEINSLEKSFVIITGPNMGGKSTYLRQTALICIMAQVGCFVPAKSARIGITDRIFARLGASDNLSEGESTFMVEMREAAHIISHASERSLLLIDEVGRGTATADGSAIAQAILEWVVCNLKARTLFATHFHELTTLETELDAVLNLSVGSYEENGQVIFTHHIKEGPANRSYGIEVAKLAGLPKPLLRRAQQLLLESIEHNGVPSDRRQISLFSPVTEPTSSKAEETLKLIRQKLSETAIESLTPLAALNILSALKDELLNE